MRVSNKGTIAGLGRPPLFYDCKNESDEEEEEEEEEDKIDCDDAFYVHKICTVVFGTTQDSVDACTSRLLCKTMGIPPGEGSEDLKELTMVMVDKSFYKKGTYVMKFSTHAVVSIGEEDDYEEKNASNENYFGRAPEVFNDKTRASHGGGNNRRSGSHYSATFRTKDNECKGDEEEEEEEEEHHEEEIATFKERMGSFNDRINEEREPKHNERGSSHVTPRYVVLPLPKKKFFDDRKSFSLHERSFRNTFERMKRIEYNVISLKCTKLKRPSRSGDPYSPSSSPFVEDPEEIMYSNDPLMLTSTLENSCGQVCSTMCVIDLEMLAVTKHEIWSTEKQLEELERDCSRASRASSPPSPKTKVRSGAGVLLSEEESEDEDEDEDETGYSIVEAPMTNIEHSAFIRALRDKLDKLKASYEVELHREKNKLYNAISLECFVKRPWFIAFYLPFHCYQNLMRREKEGFSLQLAMDEAVIFIFEMANFYSYFLDGTHGRKVHVTFVNCGFDGVDTHVKKIPREYYVERRRQFYANASIVLLKRAAKSTPRDKTAELDKLKESIVVISNDEVSALTKRLVYYFYTKDRLQKHPVLTKINVKRLPE